MTEEIINGVDVSGCGFLDNNRTTKLLLCNECNSNFEAMECKDYHDCYYKQLKRLELENAKLKKENEILQTSLEMIKNTEGQAHIKAIELTKKLEKIKHIMNVLNNVGYYKDLEKTVLQIIEGAEDE